MKVAENQHTGSWCLSWSIGNERHRIATDGDVPAKMSDVFWSVWKHVEIFRPTPQVNESLKVLGRYEVLWLNRRQRRGTTVYIGLRRNYTATDMRVCRGEDIAIWQGGVSNLALNMRSQPFSRRAAGVLPVRSETPTVSIGGDVVYPFLFKAIGRHESAFIRDQRLSVQNTLSASGDPQRHCEGRNYDCCQGSNAVPIGVDETPCTPAISINGDAETGWVFFGGSAAFILWMLFYAALEWWRERALETNKHDQNGHERH